MNRKRRIYAYNIPNNSWLKFSCKEVCAEYFGISVSRLNKLLSTYSDPLGGIWDFDIEIASSDIEHLKSDHTIRSE